VCDSPDQAAHYQTLGSKLAASSLTRHLAGLGVKVVYWFIRFLYDESFSRKSVKFYFKYIKVGVTLAQYECRISKPRSVDMRSVVSGKITSIQKGRHDLSPLLVGESITVTCNT
jgi:hypothetical protein